MERGTGNKVHQHKAIMKCDTSVPKAKQKLLLYSIIV